MHWFETSLKFLRNEYKSVIVSKQYRNWLFETTPEKD